MLLKEQVIGRLAVEEKDGRAAINAHCEIMKRFVQIIDSDGFLVSLVANSKLAVVRALVRKEILNQINKCLGPIRLEASSDE